jgi:hypothetical protein
MKHSLKVAKLKQKKPTKQLESSVEKRPARLLGLPRWAFLFLCLFFATGITWAVFELVWSPLPSELVGRWEVSEGPQRGSIFEFFRRGVLEAHLNNPRTGMMEVMEATVALADKKLLVTTRNPHTQKDETRSCLIKELTERTLIVEFENGEVFKMTRAQ